MKQMAGIELGSIPLLIYLKTKIPLRGTFVLKQMTGIELGSIPPLIYFKTKIPLWGTFVLKQMTGIEPAYSAWEADVLPLNYICMI